MPSSFFAVALLYRYCDPFAANHRKYARKFGFPLVRYMSDMNNKMIKPNVQYLSNYYNL